MFQEVAEWHTKLAGLPYNERNVEKAKRLMKEAGYKGEPIRFMATKEYKWMYDFAVMMKQQMEDIGFVVDLQVVDWATLSTRRFNPKEYDVFTTGIGIGAQFDPCSRRSCPARGGLDLRRGDREEQPGAGARDRRAEATRPVGAADTALVREGAVDPAGRPPRAPGRAEDGQGAQREHRAPRFYNVWLERSRHVPG